jgi:NAD(P)-dependent dehydrogenase (short-subunit alcohol dehydrogenase family)
VSDLSQRVVLVTGAGSGIGLAAATAALKQGALVAFADRDGAAVRNAVADAAQPGRTLAIECDVTSVEQVDAAFEVVETTFGPVSGLVNSAAIERGGPSHLVDPAAWRSTIEVNLTGTFQVSQRALRAEASRQGLSIVCVSSPAAFVGFAAGENAAYSASKGGVSALTRTLAIEYAPNGVRVNAVVPGATETPLMWANVPSGEIDGARREVEGAVPLGRLADPDEIAEAIVWLLGNRSAYVTGTHLVCDGGLLAKAAISV